jgi:NADPH-dependent curcumin reductase CurA
LCPAGISIYFDNVGGAMLDAALFHLAQRARIVLCGFMSSYNCSRGESRPFTVRGIWCYAAPVWKASSSATTWNAFQKQSTS